MFALYHKCPIIVPHGLFLPLASRGEGRGNNIMIISINTTQVNGAKLHNLIGSSISGYQVIFTSWRHPEEKK